MGKDLSELATYFRPLAQQLLAECARAGYPCDIIDTGRTPDEQSDKIKKGVSWTKWSKHEPQPPEMKSEAIDIAPKAILVLKKPNWDPRNPIWKFIGAIGKRLGLVWGGDWHHIYESKPGANDGTGDPSHFEYNQPPPLGVEETIT